MARARRAAISRSCRPRLDIQTEYKPVGTAHEDASGGGPAILAPQRQRPQPMAASADRSNQDREEVPRRGLEPLLPG